MNSHFKRFHLNGYKLAEKLTEYAYADKAYCEEIEELCGSHLGIERYMILVELIEEFEDENPKTIVKLLAERFGVYNN